MTATATINTPTYVRPNLDDRVLKLTGDQSQDYSRYPGGIKDWDKAIYRYALQSTKSPNLIIPDYIQDAQGDIIPPGYYELVLSDDKTFLLLVQSGVVIATVPVFNVQIEKSDEINYGPAYEKYKKKVEKKRAKQNKKLKRFGNPQEEETVYMDASIEYVKDGSYYLIKYERDKVRAWGAIK